jgi:hypothetical protein
MSDSYESNYEQVLDLIRRHKEGTTLDEIAQELFLDGMVALACLRRAIKSGNAVIEIDTMLIKPKARHDSKTMIG